LSRSTIERLRLFALLVAAAAVLGGLDSLVQASPGVALALGVATGASIGAAIAACVIGFELFGAAPLLERGGRSVPLALALLVRLLLYAAVIAAALLLIPWLLLGRDPAQPRPGLLGDAFFALAGTLVFVAAISVAQLIGPRTLGNLLLARYYRPRREQRIVLFLDMVGSTDIAERIGDVRFHAMLSDAFTRLSRVVTDCGGEVYRYVGDALIATWPLGAPADNARAIRCVLACREALSDAAFRARHGEVPGFRAGLHAGPLVAGEIGGFRREIALTGDTMNTAARLEQACRATGHDFVLSRRCLERTELPPAIVATSLGVHRLRGKAAAEELFALDRRR
jgi:adenylate cyclase